MKKVLVFICSVIAMTVLSSCGQSYVGKWQSKELKLNGMTVNSDYRSDTGLPAGSAFQMEIREDGTGTIKRVRDLMGDEIEWKDDGGKLMMRYKGEDEYDMAFTLDGEQLTNIEGVYLPYGIYGESSRQIKTVVCERVDSFYNTSDLQRYKLSYIGKAFYAAVSGALTVLKNEGRFTEIPDDSLRFDIKNDPADTDLKKCIVSTAKDYGLEEGVITIRFRSDIYAVDNIKITDPNGITGEFDSRTYSESIGITTYY